MSLLKKFDEIERELQALRTKLVEEKNQLDNSSSTLSNIMSDVNSLGSEVIALQRILEPSDN